MEFGLFVCALTKLVLRQSANAETPDVLIAALRDNAPVLELGPIAGRPAAAAGTQHLEPARKIALWGELPGTPAGPADRQPYGGWIQALHQQRTTDTRVWASHVGDDVLPAFASNYFGAYRALGLYAPLEGLIWSCEKDSGAAAIMTAGGSHGQLKYRHSYGFRLFEATTNAAAAQSAVSEPRPAADRPVQVAATFRRALGAIAKLSQLMDSPFAEAFATVESLLDWADRAGPNESRRTLADAALSCAATEHGADFLCRAANSLELFEKLGADAATLARLLACEAADVFGGMGSWNDQPVAQQHQAEYRRVSAEFFAALQAYLFVVVDRLGA